MYQALDNFLNSSTWHSGHALDLQSFHLALNDIVDQPAFHADQMGNYMLAAKGITVGSNPTYEKAIDDLVAAAHAVRDFLQATKR